MTEIRVNNNDISGYLASDALDDGKIDENELLAAINSFNTENEDNPITGDLAITYSSSEVTLDETITDGDIAGTTATITDLSSIEESNQEESLEDQLADVGIGVLTSTEGELLIYASTEEELAKVQEVLEKNGMTYDVTATSKSEAEIQEYLDSTLSAEYPDGVGKGSGDDYSEMMDDSIMQMSFYDAEGKDVTYSINDVSAIEDFKTWLETETVEETATDSAVEETTETQSVSNGEDAIDISKATILGSNEDISAWEVAYDLSVTVDDDYVTFDQDLTSDLDPNAEGLTGNAWVYWYGEDGELYGATFEWFKQDQEAKGSYAVSGDHIKDPSLDESWAPVSGQTVYFCASGLCRNGETNSQVRTNVVETTWP